MPTIEQYRERDALRVILLGDQDDDGIWNALQSLTVNGTVSVTPLLATATELSLARETVPAVGSQPATMSSRVCTQGVIIKAKTTNLGVVQLGEPSFSNNTGYELNAGENIFLPIANTNLLATRGTENDVLLLIVL